MKVAIIDYGMGNLASVQNALKSLHVSNVITSDKAEIEACSHILLPGVGSFERAMTCLHKTGLQGILNHEVITMKKPFLGICLGMQLVFETGNEPKPSKGLGWLQGDVQKFNFDQLRIPHMGWNTAHAAKKGALADCMDGHDFYFIHSYHAVPTHSEDILATFNYGIEGVAAVQKDNIFACQFHPEKSQAAGLHLLKTYFEQNA